jgi:hypothetical protein
MLYFVGCLAGTLAAADSRVAAASLIQSFELCSIKSISDLSLAASCLRH